MQHNLHQDAAICEEKRQSKRSMTYVGSDALSSLRDFGEGIIDGGDVGDDRLLIWRWNINIWREKMENLRKKRLKTERYCFLITVRSCTAAKSPLAPSLIK